MAMLPFTCAVQTDTKRLVSSFSKTVVAHTSSPTKGPKWDTVPIFPAQIFTTSHCPTSQIISSKPIFHLATLFARREAKQVGAANK